MPVPQRWRGFAPSQRKWRKGFAKGNAARGARSSWPRVTSGSRAQVSQDRDLASRRHAIPLSCADPRGRGPIARKLVTNLPIHSRTGAIEKMERYAWRSKTEVFHRILKSGGQAERPVNLLAPFCIFGLADILVHDARSNAGIDQAFPCIHAPRNRYLRAPCGGQASPRTTISYHAILLIDPAA